MSFDWAYLLEVTPTLAEATLVTIRLAFFGYLLALLSGLILAVLRLVGNRAVSRIVLLLSESIRLTPPLVQLFFAYYVLPEIGIKLPAEPTGILVLGLHYATYTAEVYRSGILAIPRGQWEAASSLYVPTRVVWQKIILPQAVRPMVPALGNYFIQLIKEVPLLSTITVYELLNTANLLAGQSFRYFETLTFAGLIFFLLCYPSSLFFRHLEIRNERRRAR